MQKPVITTDPINPTRGVFVAMPGSNASGMQRDYVLVDFEHEATAQQAAGMPISANGRGPKRPPTSGKGSTAGGGLLGGDLRGVGRKVDVGGGVAGWRGGFGFGSVGVLALEVCDEF